MASFSTVMFILVAESNLSFLAIYSTRSARTQLIPACLFHSVTTASCAVIFLASVSLLLDAVRTQISFHGGKTRTCCASLERNES
jgi:hypothetical protein